MSSFGFNYNLAYPFLVSHIPVGTPTAVSDHFNITVYPYWFRAILLQWTVPFDWGNVAYNIYSSSNETGPYEKRNTAPFGIPYFEDMEARSFSKYNNIFYIVEAVFPNGQTVQSRPTTTENKNSSWVKLRRVEVTRREWLLLRKFVGVKSYLFKKKLNGARCSTCWNSDSMRVMNDKCPECLGTSWSGGYWDPIETLIQYNVTPNDIAMDYRGQVEPSQIQGWTIDVPTINDFDIIYRHPDNRAYRVERVEPTELQTVTVRQIFALAELSKESVEHKELFGRL
jgi:hypothetical protein